MDGAEEDRGSVLAFLLAGEEERGSAPSNVTHDPSPQGGLKRTSQITETRDDVDMSPNDVNVELGTHGQTTTGRC